MGWRFFFGPKRNGVAFVTLPVANVIFNLFIYFFRKLHMDALSGYPPQCWRPIFPNLNFHIYPSPHPLFTNSTDKYSRKSSVHRWVFQEFRLFLIEHSSRGWYDTCQLFDILYWVYEYHWDFSRFWNKRRGFLFFIF